MYVAAMVHPACWAMSVSDLVHSCLVHSTCWTMFVADLMHSTCWAMSVADFVDLVRSVRQPIAHFKCDHV